MPPTSVELLRLADDLKSRRWHAIEGNSDYLPLIERLLRGEATRANPRQGRGDRVKSTENIPAWLHNAFESESGAKKNIALRMLVDELAEARAALRFYADPFAWKVGNDPEDTVRVPDFYNETSFGDTATAALGEDWA